MSDSANFRLIVDPPAPGAWNMAVDEALLDEAADAGCVTLRFYLWQEATLSLGYFQSHADRQSHAASANCAIVRRPTGGGAILHDHELTYSLIVPAEHLLARDAERLYSVVHRAIIAALAPESDAASLQLWQPEPESPAVDSPFLCFQRRSAGDVVLVDIGGANHKIVGSAQRRRRRAVLQHGSILLHQSPFAPELPGWADLSGNGLTTEDLTARIIGTLPTELIRASAPWQSVESASTCRGAAERLVTTKYATDGWVKRR